MPSVDELESARQRAFKQGHEGAIEFQEGFTIRSFLGALFVAFVMLPGGVFLGLVAGQGIGEAAEWVTIVLFAEVARRSFQPLRKQETYILFYIATSLTALTAAERGLAGGPFSSLIWNAYTIQSAAFSGFVDQVPAWAVPSPSSGAVVGRSLFHADWALPIVLLILTEMCIRISWMGLGYSLFRLTSDVERLPFPMAPVAASGATALAEAGSKSESWRWNVFSTGAVIGLIFGFFYLAVPIFSGTVFGRTLEIFPIPWADYTKAVESILPAAIVGLSFSLANVMMGFVLPFPIVLGATIGSVVCQIALNPVLKNIGLLPSHVPGGVWPTKLAVDMDFWLSVGIGVNIAVGILGIALVIRHLREHRVQSKSARMSLAPPPGRGDFPIWWGVSAYAAAVLVLVVVSRFLVPEFPIGLLLFFGLVWSPINSYISARMIGITGRGVGFPYVKEAVVVASRYPKVDIWYSPMPLYDHGGTVQKFRELELTGTKFTSMIKAEIVMFPLILLASFLFWSFFYGSGPMDSSQYPYAQHLWPYHAQSEAVWKQVNLAGVGDQSQALNALKPGYIAGGAAAGLGVYALFSLFKLPMLAFYGFAGGIGLFPMNTIPQLAGAIIGKRYFAKRYGEERWTAYAPVLLAGFSCGSGLIAMVSISLALVAKSVSSLPY
jgi:hypothetical protein